MVKYITKYMSLCILCSLLIVAVFDSYIMQVISFGVISLLAIAYFFERKPIQEYLILSIIISLLLFQYIFVIDTYNVSATNLILLFSYFLIYFAIFNDLDRTYNLHKSYKINNADNCIFLSFFVVLTISLVSGDYSKERYSGPFDNVLNFTGMIAVFYSFYIAFYGVTKRSFIVTILVGFIAVLSVSKILILLLIYYLFKFSVMNLKNIIASVCLFLVVSGLTVTLFDFQSLISNLFPDGAIDHRIGRYTNILEFDFLGIPIAHSTICSKFMLGTCLTSESFIFGFLLSYGFSGLLLILFLLSKIKNLDYLPIFICMLFTGSYFTPSTILTLWTVLTIVKNLIAYQVKQQRNFLES